MTLKTEIKKSEFQKLQEKYPNDNLLKIYTPIPDEEWESRPSKEWEELPDFLKRK